MTRVNYKHLLIALLLSGCTDKPAPDNPFPLNKGLYWEYRLETDLHEHTLSRLMTIESLGDSLLGKDKVSIRRTSDGTDYYIQQTDDGLYRVAKRTLVELAPVKDKSTQMILPTPPTQGKSWSSLTQSYTLHRTMPNFEPPDRSTLHFNMNYELAALDETVEVPAGTFEHCLRVDGRATLSLYADAKLGFHSFEVTSKEWYAPGVGLVKLERLEPLDSEVFKGGKVTLELMEFGNKTSFF